MDRALAAEGRAGKLACAVGDHLVHVHVELGAAAGHPDVQREHLVMLASEDFVAGLDDELELLVAEPLFVVVDDRGGLFQDRVGLDHIPRDQILADAEVLERALRLRAPELVRRDADLAQTVGFSAKLSHHCLVRLHGFAFIESSVSRTSTDWWW